MKINNPGLLQKNDKPIEDKTKEVGKKIFLDFLEERMENFNTFVCQNRLDQEHRLEDQE